MPGITKRADGRYMIRKMVNGKRKSLYARTLTEARNILNKFKRNKIDFESTKAIKKQYTLSTWIAEWAETYKKPKVATKTYINLIGCLKSVNESLGNINLTALKTIDIQNFLNGLKHNRTKENTELYFNSLLQKAVDIDLIKKNPFNAVEKTKKSKNKNFCFNFREQETILSAVNGTDIEHEIYTYLLTGCRPAELPTKKNFNFEDLYVKINGTKNSNAKRKVDLSIPFANYMKEYLHTHEMKSATYVQKRFKEICESINIDKILLYRLRHTFASNNFALGIPAKQVAEWMGHSSIGITLDVYTDIDKSLKKDKIKMLYNNYYIDNIN